MFQSNFYTSQDIPIILGKKIGEGSEGYVCTIKDIDGVEIPNQVAKIYHIKHIPDEDKQTKLRYMIASASNDLLHCIAWATDTLHLKQYNKIDGKPNRIVGFLMPMIKNAQSIHTLYNPSYRRQAFPDVTLKFLLSTACNIALAIDTLHKNSYVMGDVNQGNLLFAKNSKVTLIDADSFQITTPINTHLSFTGVAHFTPPELQGNTKFDTNPRKPNHDNFGLAVLIFHLLFGGRHPYAGVPLIDEVGHLLEHDIKAYRYAYAPDHEKRGIKAPPMSIPIDIVPKKVQDLFVQAFTEIGSKRKQRPTAETWMNVLEGLRSKIVTCDNHEQHEYLNHLSHCPWCELEDRGLVYFGQIKAEKLLAQKNAVHNIINEMAHFCKDIPCYSFYEEIPELSDIDINRLSIKREGTPVSIYLIGMVCIMIMSALYSFLSSDTNALFTDRIVFLFCLFLLIVYSVIYIRDKNNGIVMRVEKVKRLQKEYDDAIEEVAEYNQLVSNLNKEINSVNELHKKYNNRKAHKKSNNDSKDFDFMKLKNRIEGHYIKAKYLNENIDTINKTQKYQP